MLALHHAALCNMHTVHFFFSVQYNFVSCQLAARVLNIKVGNGKPTTNYETLRYYYGHRRLGLFSLFQYLRKIRTIFEYFFG